jgi:hypothetical protein
MGASDAAATRAFSIHMLTFGDRGRWLFLGEKPLSFQNSIKRRIENAVARCVVSKEKRPSKIAQENKKDLPEKYQGGRHAILSRAVDPYADRGNYAGVCCQHLL